MTVFGADEAGRGPVLGPMVAAAVRADPDALPDGIADSKTLVPARRAKLRAAMDADDRIQVGVAVVEPARIDDPATDMNALTVEAQADAIAAIVPSVPSDRHADVAGDGNESIGHDDRPRGIVDACDVDPERFARRVTAAVPARVAVRAEHRADETHPIVGAASVVAKVERDTRIEALAATYERYGPIGSGYPSDPTTRGFLREYVREHGALPDCARTSWRTSRDVLRAAEQSALGEF